ncbi:MAG: phenylacetate--CoA ligase family protein [Bacteroidales bacterium]|nr:phenylacetate--CoA ligase family protein [Bacteroidales bacterium]
MELYSIYKKLPYQAQNILCSLYGYYIGTQRYGRKYEDIFAQLLSNDICDKSKILGYKEENLFRIIEYAYKHCPYYKKKYIEAGVTPSSFTGISSLQLFPILTKEDVRNNYLGMISDEYSTKELIHYHTSGTTGKALDFYWTRNNLQYYWATVWRGRSRFNVYRGDAHLNFTGKNVVPINACYPPYWRYNKAHNQYLINMQQISRDKVQYIVDFINDNDFRFITGYPSIVNSLAELISENHLQVNKFPGFFFSSAEKLYEYQRFTIENIFHGLKIVEHYGFSENAAAASMCECGHYHEDFELGHLELINSVDIDKGTTGNLIATGFQNLGMPFVRYENGDVATFTDSVCPCGRHSQVITNIEGRKEDYILTPEGTKIMRLDYIFKGTYTIKECQIVQKKDGRLLLRIVRRQDYNTRVEEDIRLIIKSMISPTIGVDFEYVDEIERTKSGKFKAVVSELQVETR